MNAVAPSAAKGRLLILAAAVLWSLSGALIKLLTRQEGLGGELGLADPPVPVLVIAFYRPLFAGLFLLPVLRRADLSFRPLLVVMVLLFAGMNALFVSASGLGSAANAIILQYTAPLWLYVAGILWLHESAERRSTTALVIAMSGVAVIVADACCQQSAAMLETVLIGLASGLTFAGVILCLRVLRGVSSSWLTVLNHLFAALVLAPVLLWYASPTLSQIVFLVFFGVVQMGLPYLLMTKGLQSVTVQEAGTITLLEPLLNPLWAYLVANEVPDPSTFIGGGLILAALVWRYFPVNRGSWNRSSPAASASGKPPGPEAEAS